MDRPRNEFALAVAFGLVLFVTVLAVVVVSRPSADTALAGPLRSHEVCEIHYIDEPPWEVEYCYPGPHPTPEPTPVRDPCDDLLSGRGSGTSNNCDGADTATPVPDTATPVPDTATPVPDTATPVPDTATPIPDTATPMPDTATPIPDTATPTPVPALGAPANFSAAGSGTSITLSWGAAANVDGYQIEENDASSCGQGGAGGSGASGSGASGSEEGARGDCDSWFHLATKGAGDTSHTVTGLTHGLTYSYRIRSYRTLGGSTDYSGYAYAEDHRPDGDANADGDNAAHNAATTANDPDPATAHGGARGYAHAGAIENSDPHLHAARYDPQPRLGR